MSIVEHYVDGILAADPVSVQFRLPGGEVVAHTDYVFDDIVVRRTPSAVEVYQYEHTWVPVASRVDRFDGYSLTDITPTKRLLSPLVHTAAHWLGYVLALGLTTIFLAAWFAVRAWSKQGRLVRTLGFICVATAAVFYMIVVHWVAPISPFILLIFGCVCIVILGCIRKTWWTCKRDEGSP